LIFFTVFWVTSVLVSGYFVASAVHHCIHPTHHRVTDLVFSPEEIKGLDLFAVAGSINVRSCPFAKNITIRISEGAHNENLLQMMKTDYSVKSNIVHLFSMGPSFDWYHCQMSHIDVLVPSSLSHFHLTAQVVSGLISVDAKSSFEKVELGTSFGVVKSHNLHVTQSLNIRAMLGYVSLHEIHSNITQIELQTGVAHLHSFQGLDTKVEVRAGFVHFNKIFSSNSLTMIADVGAICAKDIGPSKTTHAVVEYGYLRLRPTASSCYAFLMETHFGHLTIVNHHAEDHHDVPRANKKSGVVGTEHAHSNIFVSTTYGHVTLVTERPITWNPEQSQ